MPGGSDQKTSTGTTTPAPATSTDLGKNIVNVLNDAITNPKPLSDGTIRSLTNIDNGVGQYQGGLNDAFNTTAGIAKNGVASLANFNAPTANFSSIGQYDQLYNQSNKPTMAATHLTDLIPGLKETSYADAEAKKLYQGTLGTSFAQQGFRDIYGELQDPGYAEEAFKSIYERLNGPTLTEQNLLSYADGSLLNANPFLDAVIKATNANTTGVVNQSFGAGGRLGSNLNIDTLGSTLSNTENAARLAQYNQDVQNQFQANSLIEAARANATGQQTQVLGGLDTARNNRFQLQSQALSGEDTATNNQLSRSLSALGAQDQFRLAQLGALRDTVGQIDTSNDNRTTTLSGVLGGKTSAEAAQAAAQQNAAALNMQAQIANQQAQLAAANSLGGQFQSALAPSLASLAVGQAIDANNQQPFNNALATLGTLGGSSAPGVAPEVPWWQSILGLGAQVAGTALGTVI